MQKICSYALFGNQPENGGATRDFYWSFLPSLVRAHHHIFPDWELRVHVDSLWKEDRGELLRRYRDAELLNIVYVEENKSTCRSMLWRLRPLWNSVGYVLSRDIDSVPSIKERKAVEVFISSGRAVHCLNDSVSHNAVMMGGMVGFDTRKFRVVSPWNSWDDLLALGPNHGLEFYTGGPDQNLQANEIYPLFYPHDVCCHRFKGLPNDPRIRHCYHDVPETAPLDIHPPVVENDFDKLCPHLGSSGYPVDQVLDFFDKHGREDIMQRVRSAEQR